MFTKEEVLEYIGPVKIVHLSDLYTPHVPQMVFPKWLPPAITAHLQEHLDFLTKEKDNPSRIYSDHYPNVIKYLNRVKIVFFKPEMKPFWKKSCQISVPKTLEFIVHLLSIENTFDNAVHQKEKVQTKELRKAEEIIEITGKLIYAMNEAQFNCFRQLGAIEGFDNALQFLKKFKDRLTTDYEKVKRSYKNRTFNHKYYPLTRKYKESNSLAIVFIRSIYAFFMQNFGKPMYEDIALIVCLIFKAAYSPNDITKLAAMVNRALDNSHQK